MQLKCNCWFKSTEVLSSAIGDYYDGSRWLWLLAFLAIATPTHLRASQSLSLVWNPSPDPRTSGYIVLYGTASGVYDRSTNVGNVAETTIGGLVEGQHYYFAVYAYGGGSLQSPLSNELAYQAPLAPSRILNRAVFYNNSAWDGYDPSASAQDDAAIATEKSALLPGSKASFVNYSSYSRGLNGIIVDISGLAGIPTFEDFTFKVGNDNYPDAWATAPSPSSITVRAGAGLDGSDRITFVWPDNSIQKTWVQVTVQATPNTRLARPDVFYFGNAIGESGNSTTSATVTSADALQVLSSVNPLPGPITITQDYNRDKKVTSADALIALNNVAVGPSALQLISPPASDELAPVGLNHADGSEHTDVSRAAVSLQSNLKGSRPAFGGASAKILGMAQCGGDGTRVWFQYAGELPVQIWQSTTLKPLDWRELPADWIKAQGNGIYEVRMPADEAITQSYFRFSSGYSVAQPSALADRGLNPTLSLSATN